ncbi:MAG TPA: hypothetical protein VGH93_00665, partial [Solirubrobacteraceae bacterium]
MTDHTTTSAAAGFAPAPGEGETLRWESQLFTIKCSTGGLRCVDSNLETGSEPPMQIHTREVGPEVPLIDIGSRAINGVQVTRRVTADANTSATHVLTLSRS